MYTETYKVKVMHCASCSTIIEKTFKKLDSVQSVEVNYGAEKAKIFFDHLKTNPHDLSKHIEPLGYSLDVPATAEDEIRRFNKLQKIVNGKTGNSLVEEDDVNIRQYAKYLLKEGSTSDKRELLANLRSRLNYKDKKITMIEE